MVVNDVTLLSERRRLGLRHCQRFVAADALMTVHFN